MENDSKRYLDTLQIYRGIAALMVVVHHAVGSLKYYHNINSTLLFYIGKFGKFGVDFFFVLSGFIISYSVFYKYNQPQAFKIYALNRLLRIYIPYLPIGIVMYFMYSYLPGFSNANREISLITSLTLLPDGNPALSVAWTLTFELCFYLLFSIFFFSVKAWNRFTLIWGLVIILFNYGISSDLLISGNPIFKMLLSPYNIEFLFGYILSLLIIHKIRISINSAITILIFVLIIFSYLFFIQFDTVLFLLNLVFGVLVLAFLYITIMYFNKKWETQSLIMKIGNASYSIYLIHNPLQMVILRFYPKISSSFGIMVSLSAVLTLSVIFGYLYSFIFEQRVMQIIKSKFTA